MGPKVVERAMATQDGRVAIVTGSARGIGRACAHALAERGYAIVLVDVLAAEMARTRSEIEKMGRPCLAYEADVALHGRAREVVEDVMQSWAHRRADQQCGQGATQRHHRA